MTHMREAIGGFFRARFKKRPQGGLMRVDMETGKITKVLPLTEIRCTYCQGTKFYEGPSGGMAMNVLCANRECRHWFNISPPIGMMDDLHQVEPLERMP